jgi:hypothetical protein
MVCGWSCGGGVDGDEEGDEDNAFGWSVGEVGGRGGRRKRISKRERRVTRSEW